MTRTKLLRIEGSMAHRYIGGKLNQSAILDPAGAADVSEFRSNLNHFLKHGLPEEEHTVGAPEVPPEIGGESAWLNDCEQLAQNPPAMTPRYKEERA